MTSVEGKTARWRWYGASPPLPSITRSEQIASLQALAKIRGGKDEDAVLGAATLGFKAYNDALLDPWIILYESAEAS